MKKVTIKGFLKGLRFLISGGLGAMVSVVLILYLTEYKGVWYIYSLIIAFIPSCIVSFIFKKFWTFEDNSIEIEKVERQSFWYVLLSIAYLIINTTLVFFTVRILNIHYLIAQASWICILFYPDFIITNKIFPKTKSSIT